jgi:hypothetical protein
MPVEYARGLLKLAKALVQDSPHNAAEARKLRDEAAAFLLEGDPNLVEYISEAYIDTLVPIFWR